MARPISYYKYIRFFIPKVVFEHVQNKINMIKPEFDN